MTRTLLKEPDKKEALSRVYVKALAPLAGYTTSVPEPDRDSVDLQIRAGGPLRPTLDLQLKATTKLSRSQDDSLRFQLPIKNYRDLCCDTQTPRLLVILELPEDGSRWMTVTSEKLVLRRRAYWLSLQQDHEDIIDQQTVTVRIPKHNLLDVETLQDLMEQSRTGEI